MPYTTFLGEKFEDEHDEELTRKFGDTYKYFKRQYPDIYKLPTEEVRGIFHEFNKSPYGDTFEKSLDRTRQYIDRRMPDWQEQYINPKAQQTQQQSVQYQNPLQQVVGAIGDMTTEYFNMKKHKFKYLDDYHHCKANYNAAARGPLGYNTAKYLGDEKERFDFYWNQLYKGKSEPEAIADRNHDLGVNATGRLRGDSGLYDNAEEACADYRLKNSSFPKKYW